jgi:hypothetical protein
MSEGYDTVENLEDQEKKPTCGEKLTNCKNGCSHFLFHTDDEGINFCCLLTFLNWFQIIVFLVCLWIISGLFWVLMFYFVNLWPMDALWAFLICWVLFCMLFAVLMALNMNQDEDRKTMGCSEEELKGHIDLQLQSGMTWDNFGSTWHIVHKIELADDNPSAEVSDRIKQVCMRMHYSNTVPVFASQLERGSQVEQTPKAPGSDEKKGDGEEKQTVVTMQQ